MKCEYCDNEVTCDTATCPYCGAVLALLVQKDNVSSVNGQVHITNEIGSTSPEKSASKRIVFMLLGVLLGFWGIHFLYAHRFLAFAVVLGCFVLSVIFSDSTFAPFEGFVILASFIASFVVKTDGNKREMPWF